jgi:hypothetical protein
MAYEGSTQALRCTFAVANGANQIAEIKCHSPVLNIAPDGNTRTFTLDVGATSDGVLAAIDLIFHFANSPDELVDGGNFTNGGPRTAQTSTQDTIIGLSVRMFRSTGGGNGPWNFTADFDNVGLS